MVRLEFELTYYDSAVLRFNHYTTGTVPLRYGLSLFFLWSPVTHVSFFLTFWDLSNYTKCNWYQCHLHIQQLFLFSWKIYVLGLLFLIFIQLSAVMPKSTWSPHFFFLLINTKTVLLDLVMDMILIIKRIFGLIFCDGFWFVQIPEGSIAKFCGTYFLGQILVCVKTIGQRGHNLWDLFSETDFGLCLYHWFVW